MFAGWDPIRFSELEGVDEVFAHLVLNEALKMQEQARERMAMNTGVAAGNALAKALGGIFRSK